MLAEPVFEVVTSLGECPVWDHRTERLWWVDIDGETVWRGDPETGTTVAFPSDGRPAALALTPDPNVLLVAREGELVWLEDGVYRPWMTIENIPGNRLNDGRVSPEGSFWVGSMHADTSQGERSGILYRVEASGRTMVSRGGIGVTNGLAFSPDGSRMYFADTFDETVDVYSIEGERLGARETFADLRDRPGKPDGGCVDEQGNYWLASVHGAALYCFEPGGRLIQTVDLPVQRPTRVTFGGRNLDRMFVTSIAHRPGVPDGPDGVDGRLMVLDVGVRGMPEAIFSD